MSGLDVIANPIGKFAPKTGIGQFLDPAGAIGRKVGGTAGQFIDPASFLREPEPAKPRTRAKAAAGAGSTLLSTSTESDRKLGGG